MSVNSFNNYMDKILPSCSPYDFKDKERCIGIYVRYMLNRLQSMFKWDGLPETIPARSIELYLMCGGHCCFAKYNDKLYVFQGGLGGEPDAYYMPTIYTVANPALEMSKMYKINEDCIVVPNDSLYMGLLPLCSRYATALVENDISINIASINSRILSLISAGDDRTKASAEKYLSDVAEGKQGIIAENAFLDGVRVQPYGSTSNSNLITNLIELEQYTKASWFNELGLNANYNMKRESLNSSESALNNDVLLPLVDDMLKQRKQACERVNTMFGTNISVSLASSWEDNQEEVDAEQDNLESTSGQPENLEDNGGEIDESET